MGNKISSDLLSEGVLVERRSGSDRRSPASFAALFVSRLRRRRSRGRRETDRGAYVDIYDSRSWSIAIAVLILSFMDALLTGLHMIRGSAQELNPILNAVINYGGLPAFFGIKAAMTILPMAVVMIHKEWTLGKYAARLCLWSYVLVSLYHLYLIVGMQTAGQSFFAG
jgi:hypothetical protein